MKVKFMDLFSSIVVMNYKLKKNTICQVFGGKLLSSKHKFFC